MPCFAASAMSCFATSRIDAPSVAFTSSSFRFNEEGDGGGAGGGLGVFNACGDNAFAFDLGVEVDVFTGPGRSSTFGFGLPFEGWGRGTSLGFAGFTASLGEVEYSL